MMRRYIKQSTASRSGWPNKTMKRLGHAICEAYHLPEIFFYVISKSQSGQSKIMGGRMFGGVEDAERFRLDLDGIAEHCEVRMGVMVEGPTVVMEAK